MSDSNSPNFSIDLTGQVALVTGAGSGLGHRFARVLAACGATVVATGRRVEKLKSVSEEIRAAGGVCEPFAMDLTDSANIRVALEKIEEAVGTPTILVNNAGLSIQAYATKMTDQRIDEVMATNLTGPYVLAVEVARRLIDKTMPGRIVNVASMAAFWTNGKMGDSVYAMSKSGMTRMTETLALEWAKFPINVNCIAPGMFASEMSGAEVVDKSLQDEWVRTFPRQRICEPDELDSTLLFLVSPSSSAVTGTVIKVDDGQFPR